MLADAGPAARAGTGPRLIERLVGLGSVYGKTIRDSRRATLVVGLLTGFIVFATAGALGSQFPTVFSRLELVAQAQLLPVALRGLLGEPIAVETLGGFVSWRVGNALPPMLGIWSVLALSGTLAGEAQRGSLDVLVATPVSRARVALQKLLGHATAVTVAMAMAALLTFVSGTVFGTLPADPIPLGAAFSHFVLTGLLMLLSGCVAFAVAPVVGRGRAAGIGFLVLFGTYLIPAYASTAPIFAALEPFSPFSWTADHRPLAGREDWLPVGVVALGTVVLGGLGILGFVRRDLGEAVGLRWLRLPSLPAGTANPFTRQLADRTGAAIGWAAGIGLYGALIAASSEAFSAGIAQLRGIGEIIARLYPGVDVSQPSGVLQLGFFAFGTLLAGLAGTTFVAGWAADEANRRLDLVLSTPVARARWAVASGLGVMAAVGLMVIVIALIIGPAVAAQGAEVATPVIGLGVLGLYAAGVAGIGLGVGGLVRASIAVPVAGGIVIGSYLLELIGNLLQLPDWVLQLSLNHHLGQPMSGRFDGPGIVLLTVLAVGGLAIGTLGLRRRDLRG